MRKTLLYCTLLLLCAAVRCQNELCHALAGFSSDSPKIDGLAGTSLEDFSWVSQQCTNGATSIRYDSGKFGVATSSVQVNFGDAKTVKSCNIQRVLEASLNDNILQSNITLNFDITFSTSTYSSISFSGTIFRTYDGPIKVASDWILPWKGKVTSPCAGLGVMDGNLFDGALPAIVQDCSTSIESALLLQMLEYPRFIFSNANLRLNALSMPSSLGATQRGAYLSPSAFSPVEDSQAFQVTIDGASGILLQSTASCVGNSCPSVLADALFTIANRSASSVCSNLAMIPSTIKSEITSEIFVSNKSDIIALRGFTAASQAAFTCNQDNIAIQLNLISPSVSLTLTSFMGDYTVAAGVINALRLTPQGTLAGTVHMSDGTLRTLPNSDLFSDLVAGVPIKDQALLVQRITSLFSSFRNVLHTGIYLLDAYIDSIFPSDPQTLVNTYSSQVQTPTFAGFMLWFAKQTPEVKTLFSYDGSTLTIVTGIHMSSAVSTSDTTTISAINSMVTNLGNLMKTKYPSNTMGTTIPTVTQQNQISATLQGYLTCNLVVNLTTDSVTAEPIRSQGAVVAGHLDFSSGTTRPMFLNADVSYQYGNGYSVIQAVVTSYYNLSTLTGGIVTVSEAGSLIENRYFPVGNNVNGISNVASFIAENYSWQGGNLEPLNFVPAAFGSTTAADAINGAANTLASSSGKTNLVISQNLVNYFKSLGNGYPTSIIARIIPIPDIYNTGKIEARILMQTFVKAQVATVATPWDWMIDMARLDFPVLLFTDLSFWVNNNGQFNLTNFAVTSSTMITGFNVAFQYGMKTGTQQQSELTLTLNLPTTSLLKINISAVDEYLDDHMVADITGQDMATQDAVVSAQVLTEKDRKIDPLAVWAQHRDILWRLIPNFLCGLYDVPIPPFAQSFCLMNAINNQTRAIIPLMTVPVSSNLLAVSQLIDPSQISGSLYINLTLNQFPETTCEISSLDMTSLTSLAKSVNAGLQACFVFGNYLTAEVANEDENNEGMIGIYSTILGQVYNLRIKAWGAFTINNVWAQQTKPNFGNHEDLARAISAALTDNTVYYAPVKTTVLANTTTDMAPDVMKDVYPDSFFAVRASMILNAKNTAWGAMMTNLQANESVNLNLPRDASLYSEINNHMTADLVIAFECAPQGGGANISIYTNFSSDTNISTVIVPPDNNTFTLATTVQQRWPDGQVMIQDFEVPIVMPPGELLMDAMMQDFLPQLPSFLQPMVIVGIDTGRSSMNDSYQFTITIQRTPSDNGSWIVPLSLGIQSSNMNGFFPCNIAPATSRTLASNVFMNVTVSAIADAANATGSAGPVVLGTASVEGNAYTSIQMTQTSDVSTPMTLKLAVNPTTMFNSFNATFDTKCDIHFANITYNLTSNSGYSDIHFTSNQTVLLKSMDDFNNLGSKVSLKVSFDDSEIWDEVIKLGTPSFCQVLTETVGVTSDLINRTSAPLPFSTISLGAMMESAIGSRLSQVQNSVCGGNQNITIDAFCDLLKSAFNREVCSSKSLNSSMLEIMVDIVALNQTFANSFRFETSYFGDTNIPVGVGTDGDLSMFGLFDIKLQIIADLAGNPKDPVFKLGTKTSFTLQTGLDANGKIKAYFGPVSTTFSNLQLHIGPVTLTATLGTNDQLSLKVLGKAFLDTVINFPFAITCRLNMNFADLFGIPTWSGDDFVSIFEAVLEKISLFDFISDPSIFVNQLIQQTQDFINKIFSPGGYIGPLRIPLIARRLEKILTEGLQKLFGPSITSGIVSGFTNTTAEILKKGLNTTKEEINKLVLKEVTKILCQTLQPIMRSSCPPVPDWRSDTYLWNFTLGEDKKQEVKDVDFDLGIHGIADLQMDCGLMLEVNWWFNVTFMYSKEQGLTFVFQNDPTLLAYTNLDFSPSCDLTGNLGFLGTDMKPSGGLMGTLLVRANFKNPTVNVTAHVEAAVELGWAGPLLKLLNSDSLEALPYWKASLVLDWYWNLQSKDTTPTFKLVNTTMCLGQILGKMMSSVANDIRSKILLPAGDIIDPKNGFLLQPIEATQFLFGKRMNAVQLADLVYRLYCQDDCEFLNVFEAIDTYVEIINIIEQLNKLFGAFDSNLCGAWQQIQDFSIDFTQPDPTPQIDFNSFCSGLQFTDDISSEYRSITTSIINSANVTGQWGFNIPLLQNVQGNIVALILGKKNIEVLQILIPKFSMGSSSQFGVPVWPFPYVELFVGYSCKLTVDFGRVALLMNGVAEAVRTNSPAKMAKALALPIRNPDGSPRYPITGYIRLEGGVSVSVFIFRGSAYAWIELDGQITFVDINKDGYLSFDEVVWILKNNRGDFLDIFELDLQLRGGFGISIQACIRILWKRKCWTITKQDWSSTIWSDRFYSQSASEIVFSSGVINMPMLMTHLFGSGTTPTLRLWWNSNGQLTADGYPAGVSTTSSTAALVAQVSQVPISSSGVHGDESFIIEMNGVLQTLYFPPSRNGILRFVIQEYRNSNTFTLTPSSVVPENANGAIGSICKLLEFVDPTYANLFYVTGIICDTNIDTQSATLQLSGSPSNFAGKRIAVTGTPNSIITSVPASWYNISGSSIYTNELSLTYALPRMVQVSGPVQAPAVFNILDTPASTTMTVIGGNYPDQAVVPDISKILGSLTLRGGVQTNGPNNFILNVFTEHGTAVTYTPNSLVQTGDQTFIVNIENFDHQIVKVKGTGLQMLVTSPPDSTSLIIDVEGTPGGVNTVNLTDCGGKSEVRIYLHGGGLMNVFLGSANQMAGFYCTVWIFGSSDPEQTDAVYIQSSSDTDFTVWDFSTSGSLNIRTPTDVNSFFVLHYQAVDQMTAQFSPAGAKVTFAGIFPTEFLLDFPQTPSGSTLNVLSATNAVAVRGRVSVLVGPAEDPHFSKPPMQDFSSLVAFVGTMDVVMNSGWNTSQHYVMNETCLNSVNEKGQTKNLTAPTSWTCGILAESGLECHTCQIQYLGNLVFNITTDKGNDSFISEGVRAVVHGSFGSARDALQWGKSTYTATFDVGVGSDNITLFVPMSPVDIWLGSDSDVDYITVWNQGRYGLSFIEPVFERSGPNPTDRVVLHDFHTEDRPEQKRLPT